jgi:hypothetical protein
VRASQPIAGHKLIIHTQKRGTHIVNEVLRSYDDLFTSDSFIFNYRETAVEAQLAEKINSVSQLLTSVAEVNSGVILYEKGKGDPIQDAELVKSKPYNIFSAIAPDPDWLKLVRGTQVNRYRVEWDGEFVKYGKCLAAPRKHSIFLKPKILVRRTDDKLLCSYDDSKMIGVKSVHSVQLKSSEITYEYLLALMNSKLLNWWFRHTNFHMVGKPMAEVKLVYVERLPIKINSDNLMFEQPVGKLIRYNSQMSTFKRTVLDLLQSKFPIDKPSKNLQNWPSLDFAGFLGELKKKKVKLSLEEEAEWMDYFTKKKAEALALQSEIDRLDREIDEMVYELYGLSEEERKVVEGVSRHTTY